MEYETIPELVKAWPIKATCTSSGRKSGTTIVTYDDDGVSKDRAVDNCGRVILTDDWLVEPADGELYTLSPSAFEATFRRKEGNT
jgi:hypothetical protein